MPSRHAVSAAIGALFCAAAMLFAAPPLHARQAAGEGEAPHKPEILVTGPRPGAPCTRATAAPPIDYACLNRDLKTVATRPAPSAADAITRDATTPSKAGTFSHTATAQRMGRNFGHSAQPYRPPAPVTANAIPARTPS